MDGITELAKLFKERDNDYDTQSIKFGQIAKLPEGIITLGDKIKLSPGDYGTCVDLTERNDNGEYKHLNKTAVLLPYSDGQRFVVIGVII